MLRFKITRQQIVPKIVRVPGNKTNPKKIRIKIYK